MTGFRQHILRHWSAAALLLAVTLVMRMIVPAGFMPAMDHGTVSITLCSGGASQVVEIAIPGLRASHQHDDKGQHEQADRPCMFAGLSAPVLSGSDTLLIAASILFFMAQAARSPEWRPVASARRLRPPLRGPPATS